MIEWVVMVGGELKLVLAKIVVVHGFNGWFKLVHAWPLLFKLLKCWFKLVRANFMLAIGFLAWFNLVKLINSCSMLGYRYSTFFSLGPS
jgi:hypothetical protein